MTEQWQELKETITEMRDNDGIGTQQEVCKFLVNYMEILEKQMQESYEDCVSRAEALKGLALTNSKDDVYRMIRELPPVTPKLKTIQEKQADSEKYQKAYDDGYEGGYAQARFDFEPKTGRWIFTKTIFDTHGCTAECSNCHKKWKTYDTIRFEEEHDYCPKCGTKMVEPQERSDKE